MSAVAEERARRMELLDTARRDAWIEYRDEIQGRTGADYERAEADSWEQLQATLEEIDQELRQVAIPR